MKALYINRDNRAKAFDVSSSKTMIEKDGYHTIPSSTVYRNRENMDDAICILFQGRVMPYGHSQSAGSMEQLSYEIVGTSLLDGKLSVDSEFSRLIHAIISNAGQVGIMVMFIAVGLMMLLEAMG
ncbi:hypothetical protein DSECCO2_509640 [anaerobic digester metagenome]|jgi:hypothetical protein